MKCILKNDDQGYRIYQSEVILNNQQEMIDEINSAYAKFIKNVDKEDINTLPFSNHKDKEGKTFISGISNFFAFTAPSPLFYDLYIELRDAIRDYVGDSRRLYMDAWVNYLPYDTESILCWHNHAFTYHGYISLDPKKTITDFEDWQITNQPGYIYIGPGSKKHRVILLEEHKNPRITIGFDVEDKTILPETAPTYDGNDEAGYTMLPLH